MLLHSMTLRVACPCRGPRIGLPYRRSEAAQTRTQGTPVTGERSYHRRVVVITLDHCCFFFEAIVRVEARSWWWPAFELLQIGNLMMMTMKRGCGVEFQNACGLACRRCSHCVSRDDRFVSPLPMHPLEHPLSGEGGGGGGHKDCAQFKDEWLDKRRQRAPASWLLLELGAIISDWSNNTALLVRAQGLEPPSAKKRQESVQFKTSARATSRYEMEEITQLRYALFLVEMERFGLRVGLKLGLYRTSPD